MTRNLQNTKYRECIDANLQNINLQQMLVSDVCADEYDKFKKNIKFCKECGGICLRHTDECHTNREINKCR